MSNNQQNPGKSSESNINEDIGQILNNIKDVITGADEADVLILTEKVSDSDNGKMNQSMDDIISNQKDFANNEALNSTSVNDEFKLRNSKSDILEQLDEEINKLQKLNNEVPLPVKSGDTTITTQTYSESLEPLIDEKIATAVQFSFAKLMNDVKNVNQNAGGLANLSSQTLENVVVSLLKPELQFEY